MVIKRVCVKFFIQVYDSQCVKFFITAIVECFVCLVFSVFHSMCMIQDCFKKSTDITTSTFEDITIQIAINELYHYVCVTYK